MCSDMYSAGQTSKKYDIPLSHLDYEHISQCTNIRELEKIIAVLRSGEEGKFPDLERHAEKRLCELNPKSRSLRKDGPILRPADLSSGDWQNIEEDLTTWTKSMQDQDIFSSSVPVTASDIVEGDENLPPVRANNVVLEGKRQKKPDDKKSKRVMPRDYKEWDKVDVDAELEKVDKDEKNSQTSKKSKLGVSLDLDAAGLSEEQKQVKANREKDKGNEAFRSHDYDESVAYYSRSISLSPLAASYNNRSLAYLKLEQWDKAIEDCKSVLNLDIDNIKALLRRGTAYKSKKDYPKATLDFEKVLKLEPQNKKAEDLLSEVNKLKKSDEKEKKEKGRRMTIEEVEDSEDEDIEVEKPLVNGVEAPLVNGHSPHDEDEINNVSRRNQMKPEQSGKIVELCDEEKRKDNKTTATTLCSNQASSEAHTNVEKAPDSSALSSTLTSEEAQTLTSSTSSSSSAVTTPESQQSRPKIVDEPEVPSSDSTFEQPTFIQLPLPPNVLSVKEEGNKMFRSGQYGEAAEQYSKAIAKLEKDTEQNVNTAILLSNRSACHLKTGNCPGAAQDCIRSLQLVPHQPKALLRRAAAYEALEKYRDAFVDYRHVLSIDSSALQAQQGASRCQSLLQQRYGAKCWREKIPKLVHVQPWEVPIIVDQANIQKGSSSTVLQNKSPPHQEKQTPSVPVEKSSIPVEKPSVLPPTPKKETLLEMSQKNKESKKPTLTREQQFEALKTKGNHHVQKGEYKEAASFYSQCISLCPDQVACYTNRALCYLKLQKPAEAESDCNQALFLEANNPKALYRRAAARKSLMLYKQSLQDIIDLLRLEPKNSAAQKEMDILKKCYKEELEKIKQKKQEQEESKHRKRMKIVEVDDDEEDDKPVRGKAGEKLKSQNKSRGAKSSQTSSGVKSKGSNSEKSSTSAKPPSPPVAPPTAPRLMKTTPYEFCQAWNSLKQCQGIQPYAEILRQISPVELPTVISNKLDGQMLQIIVRCVHEEMVAKGEVDQGYQVLDNLCKVPRFSTVSMFMSTKEKKEVGSVLDILSKTNSDVYSLADVLRLKKEYSVK